MSFMTITSCDVLAPTEKKDEVDEMTQLQQQGFMDVVKKQVSAMSQDKRGACRKCGNVGHLTYQCRNHLGQTVGEDGESNSDSDSSDDGGPAQGRAPAGDGEGARGLKRPRSDDSDSEEEQERRRKRSPSPEKKKHKKKSKDKKKKKVRVRGGASVCLGGLRY
jgi:hypothetical protein